MEKFLDSIFGITNEADSISPNKLSEDLSRGMNGVNHKSATEESLDPNGRTIL